MSQFAINNSKQKTWESFVQVREGSLLKYDYPKEGFDRPAWQKPPTKKTYAGEVTDHTRKRIITAVDLLLQLNPKRRIFNPIIQKSHDFRVSFATLTITDEITPPTEVCNEALGKLLRHFKKPWRHGKLSEQLKQYVWKLELQKRGTPHYHITSGSFLHHVELQRFGTKSNGSTDGHRSITKSTATTTPIQPTFTQFGK